MSPHSKEFPCAWCKTSFRPRENKFITFYAPQKPAIDFCSVLCLNRWHEQGQSEREKE